MRTILFLAIFASVYFLFGVREDEDVCQFLLNGSDAAGVLTFDDISYFGRKL